MTYSNASKLELLGVRAADLAAHGAVSAPVAEQMARGARERAGVEVGVGDHRHRRARGRQREKPVGTVFVARPHAASGERWRRGTCAAVPGPRATIRERAAQTALDLVRRRLRGLPLEAKLG